MRYIKSNRTLLAVYLLILFAHITLIWTLRYVPTQDGPSHIYNLAILHDLLHGGEIWGEYYTHYLQIYPNLGFQIFTYPLLSFLDPWQAEKAFLTLYICLMGLSVPIFLKTFDRPVFPVSFFVFPVILNFTLLMGFYSYCIAIPFFLLAFCLAWIIQEKQFYWKISTYTLCGLTLFYLHLIPFVIYILALFSISVSEYFKGAENNKFLKSLACIAPLIGLFFYYILTNTQDTTFSFQYLFSLKRMAYLFFDFVSFSTITYYINIFFIPIGLFVAVIWVLLLISIRDIIIDKQYEHIAYSPFFLTALGLLLFYLLFPFDFAGGAYFNQRFPWVIFLLSLPLINIPQNNIFFRNGYIIIFTAVIFFVFNAAFMFKNSYLVERYMIGLSVPISQNALIMNLKKTGSDNSRADFLLHAVSHYALVYKAVNAGNYEAHLDYFPVKFREDFPYLPQLAYGELSPLEIDWDAYPDIEYLMVWTIDQDERKNIKKFFGLVFEQGDLSIWHNIQD